MRTFRMRVVRVDDLGFRIERRRWFGWSVVAVRDTVAEARAYADKAVKDWRLIHPLKRASEVVLDMTRCGR